MSEPMSEERLAEIREDWASGYAFRIEDQELVMRHHAAITDLLAEVERLRAEVAAMRPIVEAVALGKQKRGNHVVCICSAPFDDNHHENDCPIAQARAYIAQHPATGEGEEQQR